MEVGSNMSGCGGLSLRDAEAINAQWLKGLGASGSMLRT